MFAGTIHDNIAYGRPGASDAEVVDAAKAAHVDGFVRTLPEGYATVLDEDASNLSSGQKQLLTIAAPSSPTRASSSSTRPPATSTPARGPHPRGHGAPARGRTSFVIAHRLSTIREANPSL